jgi:hypothetical protein
VSYQRDAGNWKFLGSVDSGGVAWCDVNEWLEFEEFFRAECGSRVADSPNDSGPVGSEILAQDAA